MAAIRDFLRRVKTKGEKRKTTVKTMAMGRERVFEAWDVDADTYIFEKSVCTRLGDHPSILITEKKNLGSKSKGHVFTMTTGNHSVAAFPLLVLRYKLLLNAMHTNDLGNAIIGVHLLKHFNIEASEIDHNENLCAAINLYNQTALQ